MGKIPKPTLHAPLKKAGYCVFSSIYKLAVYRVVATVHAETKGKGSNALSFAASVAVCDAPLPQLPTSSSLMSASLLFSLRLHKAINNRSRTFGRRCFDD